MSAVSCSATRAVVAPVAVAKRSDSAKAARKPATAPLTASGFAAASLAATPGAFAATEAISQTADGVGVAGAAPPPSPPRAAFYRHGSLQAPRDTIATTGGYQAASVRDYRHTGFDRWKKIYGETDDVNKVQLDIREGHQMTVDRCSTGPRDQHEPAHRPRRRLGTGSSPSPPSAVSINASDISSAMVGEAEVRYNALVEGGAKAPAVAPKFEALGLEDCSGKYNLVTCIDVMIHYPTDRVNDMISHLASLSDDKLIISFAPKTLAYSILKRIGELFPGPSKATRAYLHAEEDVEAALNAAGFKVTRREMTSTQFYFSRLLECERV